MTKSIYLRICKCEVVRTAHENSTRYAGVKLPQHLQGGQRKVAEWESEVPREMERPQHEKG